MKLNKLKEGNIFKWNNRIFKLICLFSDKARVKDITIIEDISVLVLMSNIKVIKL